MTEPSLALVSATANGVLGEYDHSISLGEEDEFAIIYGPNGVGKTKFLEVVDALSGLRGASLSMLPFDNATLQYSDGSELSAERTVPAEASADAPAVSTLPDLTFTLRRPGQSAVSWSHEDDDFTAHIRRTGRYEQLSESLWQDLAEGDAFHIDELRARFGPRSHASKVRDAQPPTPASDFVKRVPSFLIETQRLRTEQALERPSRPSYRSAREPRPSGSRITEQAKTIRSLLNDAQTEHSRITQQLDRTFPNRVLGATARAGEFFNQEAIRERYNTQNDFRSRLGRVASVSLADELSLPDSDLDDWALTLLNQYLEDADKKLAPFEDLLAKIELLEHIVSDRLLNKTLRVTASDGLCVEHAGTKRNIPLESLSSGEQHEIIVLIDLLFNVPRGAVVLIDEPEISLHVAWQIAFIPDVRRIAEIVGFRFIVATHSPQIINDQWDRAIRLGPEGASF